MSKYISLENLERYDAKMQERTASFCASKEDGMWRQTEKAGAVSFWPVGNSPLEGTVEFMFKETGPASGTKSPDNPSTISGVSSIGLTVCQEEGVDEHSYTLSLGGTYYGGSIDLATGLMTVTHTSMKVDGTLSYTSSAFYEGTDYYRMGFYPAVQRPNTGEIPVSSTACDILPVMPVGSTIDTDCFYFPSNSLVIRVYMLKTTLGLGDGENYSTVANALASFFTAHPAQLVYPVRTPTTVQLTPPQILALPQPDKYVPRLNTVYTDADSVQIVYQKNPVRDKFEKVQAIIAQGGNV